jgi:hypothetical protein
VQPHPPPYIPPYTPVPEIPADQPFVLQQSVGKRFAILAGVGSVPFLLVGVVIGLGILSSDGGVAGFLGAIGCMLVLTLFFAGLQLAVQIRRGPLLAVGPAGLWVRTRPFRSAGIWLPWEAIAQIYRKRWVWEKYLCVQPHDPRVGQNLPGLGQLDASMSKAVFGTGLLVSLTMAQRGQDEIMQALAYFSAGRVPLR